MKKPYVTALILILLAVLVMVFGFRFNPEPKEGAPKLYAFVVADDTGTFFMQLKRGVDDAAADYKVKCTVEVGQQPPKNGYAGAVVYGDYSIDLPCVVIQSQGEGDLEGNLKALESGEIDGFWVQDPYAMGYRAMAALITGSPVTDTPLTYITKENAYLKENIKLVFPLLQ